MSELPASWVMVSLGEIGTVGSSRRVRQEDWQAAGVPFYRAREIAVLSREGKVENELFISRELFKRLSTEGLIPEAGDLMITGVGTIGVPYVVKKTEEFYFKDASVLIFKNRHRIVPEYLYYFFTSEGCRRQIHAGSKGTTVDTFTIIRANELPIPLPPLAEQKRIVAKIEELFSELEAGEESLRLARRQLGVYRQSLLKQAFEGHLTAKWRTQNPAKLESPAQLLARIQSARQAHYKQQLGEWERAVSSWMKAGQKGKRPTKPSEPAIFEPKDFAEDVTVPDCWAIEQIGNCPTDSLIGLVRSADEQTVGPSGFSYIKMDRVDMGGSVDIAPEVFVACTANEVERFALRKGDILFNTRNSVELVGKVGIVRRDPESPTVYNNNLMRIRLPECLDPVFVGLQLCAQPFRQRMERVKKATTSVAAVYAKDFWPLPLAVCSLSEQQEIVRLLDEQFEVIERNEREIDGALRQSDALRQAILQKAFTGRLVPQSPSDEPASELLARLQQKVTVAPKRTRQRPALIAELRE